MTRSRHRHRRRKVLDAGSKSGLRFEHEHLQRFTGRRGGYRTGSAACVFLARWRWREGRRVALFDRHAVFRRRGETAVA